MEFESTTNQYQFLTELISIQYFAETDFKLRQGRHIQDIDDDRRIFRYLTDYYDFLHQYYLNLFAINLRKEYSESEVYFFLDFPEENKGKFKYERSWEIKDKYLIFGILILNLYYEKYFEKKIIKWEEIEQVILEGDKKQLWMKLLFPEVRGSQTMNEWMNVKKIIKNAIDDFADLGWVRWIDKEEILFEILPAIDRLNKMYQTEIELIGKSVEQENQ